MPTALHFTPDADANRLLAVGAARGDDRDAARPAGPDGVGVHRAAAAEGAARRRPARRDRDRGDGRRARSRRSSATSPRCTATRARWPSGPTPCARTSSSTTAAGPRRCGRTRATGDELLAAGRRAARVRQGEGADLRRPARQAARRAPGGWEVVAADWPSIADVDSFERVLEIREQKRAMKAAASKPRAATPTRRAEPAVQSARLMAWRPSRCDPRRRTR